MSIFNVAEMENSNMHIQIGFPSRHVAKIQSHVNHQSHMQLILVMCDLFEILILRWCDCVAKVTVIVGVDLVISQFQSCMTDN